MYETGKMPEESELQLDKEAHALSYDEIKIKWKKIFREEVGEIPTFFSFSGHY